MIELIIAEVALPVIIFVAGFLVRKFIVETKNEKVFLAIIRLIEALLERFEVDVPEFLRELLEEMHELTEDTEVYESIVLDEINKVDK